MPGLFNIIGPDAGGGATTVIVFDSFTVEVEEMESISVVVEDQENVTVSVSVSGA